MMMARFILAYFFSLVLVAAMSKTSDHHQVAAHFCLDDWVDKSCAEKRDSDGCLQDCTQKYGYETEGYCAYNRCFCSYQCPDSPISPRTSN